MSKKVVSSNPIYNSEIEDLKTSIKRFNAKINKGNGTSNDYYLKAKALIKLGEFTGDSQRYEQAITAFTEAIRLSPEDTITLVERSQLHVKLGHNDLAVKDMQDVNKLYQQGKGDILENAHVKNALENLAKLDTIKETVQKLREDSDLSEEFLVAFESLTNVTAGLCVTVGQHEERLGVHDKQLAETMSFMEEIKSAVGKGQDVKVFIGKMRNLIEQTSQQSKQISEIQKEVVDLEASHEAIKKALQPLLNDSNIKILEEVISDKQFDEQVKLEIDAILKSPYQRAFYETLQWQLNAIYLASTVIKTEMVENQKKGIVGKIGVFADTISAHIPLVGIGVKLVGQILKSIDQYQQEEQIGAYAALVTNPNEMANLAEVVTRKILQAKSKYVESRASVYSDRIGDVAEFGSDVVEAAEVLSDNWGDAVDIATAAAETPTKLIDYAKRFIGTLQKDERDHAVIRGEKDAEIAAKVIVKKIFTGEVSEARGVEEKAIILIETAKEAFKIHEVTADSAASSSVTTQSSVKSEEKDANEQKKNELDSHEEQDSSNGPVPPSSLLSLTPNTTVLQEESKGNPGVTSSAHVLEITPNNHASSLPALNPTARRIDAEQQKTTTKKADTESASLFGCCTVMAINNITYDNPILNDNMIGELLRFARDHLGALGMDKLLGLGSNPDKLALFQGLRKQIGDKEAIILFLDGDLNQRLISIKDGYSQLDIKNTFYPNHHIDAESKSNEPLTILGSKGYGFVDNEECL